MMAWSKISLITFTGVIPSGATLRVLRIPFFSSHFPNGIAPLISDGTTAMVTAVHTSSICSTRGSKGR